MCGHIKIKNSMEYLLVNRYIDVLITVETLATT